MLTPLRLDDIGASSKRWARHARKWWPYRELRTMDWWAIIEWLRETRSSMTVAVTACWVERRGELTPYATKFPGQTAVIRLGVKLGCLEVACHGLTHCIPGRHISRWPWQGNRRWHREFIPELPWSKQVEHLRISKALLEDSFDADVTTLVPPGNVISENLASTAFELGYETVTMRCPTPMVKVLDDRSCTVLHDRDLIPSAARTLGLLSPPYTTVRDWARAINKTGHAKERAQPRFGSARHRLALGSVDPRGRSAID